MIFKQYQTIPDSRNIVYKWDYPIRFMSNKTKWPETRELVPPFTIHMAIIKMAIEFLTFYEMDTRP